MKISKKEALKYLLWYQNLAKPRSLKYKQDIMSFIKKVGCIQYDPLNTVGYNPNLVLQSRVKNYQPKILYNLLYEDKLLVDGWDKCMSIYSRDEWAYFSRVREMSYVNRTKYNNSQVKNAVEQVKQVIKDKGPICSIDLDISDKVKWFWGSTKLARAVLEYLFVRGEIVVHHKVGTRKYYDLAENVIAKEHLVNHVYESDEQYFEWYVLRRLKSIGLLWNRASDAWLGIHNLKSGIRNKAFNSLKQQIILTEVEVESIKYKFYLPTEYYNIFNNIMSSFPKQKKVAFIAPLDNLMWDRKLINELFNFEYTWEVYTPAAKRKYGYYVLPVLYGDKFVARFEPRFNKKSKQLVILNWWWQKNVRLSKTLKEAIEQALDDFCKYLGAVELIGRGLIFKL